MEKEKLHDEPRDEDLKSAEAPEPKSEEGDEDLDEDDDVAQV